MQAREVSVKPVGQAAQLFAGVSARSGNAVLVRVERAQALGAVVKVERQRGEIGKGTDAGDG